MEDLYRHQGLRRLMLKELEGLGIADDSVLQAMLRVPRHWFIDNAFVEVAYENRAFQIGSGQTISQPYTVAFQTSLLGLTKQDKVLEIGTGSGYQTAVLCEMGAKVWSIERQKLLHDKSKRLLAHMGYRAHLKYGDGFKGLPMQAPFSKILITCGAPYIPQDLLHQLCVGGQMVIPVGEGGVQVMTRITKTSVRTFEKEELGEFSFVPMLKNRERREV